MFQTNTQQYQDTINGEPKIEALAAPTAAIVMAITEIAYSLILYSWKE